jgi:hypothetical protein
MIFFDYGTGKPNLFGNIIVGLSIDSTFFKRISYEDENGRKIKSPDRRR